MSDVRGSKVVVVERIDSNMDEQSIGLERCPCIDWMK